jgi:hypothetical protein
MKIFFFQYFNLKKLICIKINTLDNNIAIILFQSANKQNDCKYIT